MPKNLYNIDLDIDVENKSIESELNLKYYSDTDKFYWRLHYYSLKKLTFIPPTPENCRRIKADLDFLLLDKR